MFTATVEAGLKSLGADWIDCASNSAAAHEQWYKGDGTMRLRRFPLGYYNSFVIHPMLLDVLTVPRTVPRGRGSSRPRSTARRSHAAVQSAHRTGWKLPEIGRSLRIASAASTHSHRRR